MSEADTRKLLYYAIPTIDLSSANTDTEIDLPGLFDTLIVSSITGAASIRLNERTRDLIDLSVISVINTQPISKIFLTNTAQVGASLSLLAGTDSSFGIVPSVKLATFPPWFVSFGYAVSQVTTNAYVTYGTAHGWVGKTQATIILIETGGINGALYQVQGSLDGTNWYTIKTNQPLVAGNIVQETITDLWSQLRIQIIDAVAGNHATVKIQLMYKAGD